MANKRNGNKDKMVSHTNRWTVKKLHVNWDVVTDKDADLRVQDVGGGQWDCAR